MEKARDRCVRGKADPLIKLQVENVTQKNMDDESNEDNILEVLSKKQQELTESNKETEPKIVNALKIKKRPRFTAEHAKTDKC